PRLDLGSPLPRRPGAGPRRPHRAAGPRARARTVLPRRGRARLGGQPRLPRLRDRHASLAPDGRRATSPLPRRLRPSLHARADRRHAAGGAVLPRGQRGLARGRARARGTPRWSGRAVELILGNPAGLWALLGVPAVLAVHWLQQRVTPTPVSTLFLIQALAPASVRGRRIDRLRSSIPLWLQLAAVLVLAWVAAEPRWVRADSVQRVAVVLDDSASMAAFVSEVPAILDTRL